MKKMIMTLMMVLSMTVSANAQRLDNTYMEARILNTAQWNLYKKASYFYRPISWRQGSYVHNIYAKYPSSPRMEPGNNRVTKPMPEVNRPVTLPMPNNERPVNISTKRNPSNMTAKKEEPKRSFGSMRR